MKTLHQLKNKLGVTVLSAQETTNTKGGLRFETTDYVEFVVKLTNLGGQGICVCWEQHNGVYCIDW